jgi:PAS domain S-box-containing protein
MWICLLLMYHPQGAARVSAPTNVVEVPQASIPIADVARLPEGSTTRVAGRITLGTGTLDLTRLRVMLQDATGGMSLYNPTIAGHLLVGDSVEANGVFAVYRGMPELKDARVRLVPSWRRIPPPVQIDADGFANRLGQLVRLEGVVLHTGSPNDDPGIVLRTGGTSKGTREVTLSESAAGEPPVDFSVYGEGDHIRTVGVLGRRDQRTGGALYVIYPRSHNDVELIGWHRAEFYAALRVGALIALSLALVVTGLVFALRAQVRRRTASLSESESRYRSLVDYLPDGIAVHADDRIVFVNAAFAELLGASKRDELIGVPVLDVFHADDRAGAAARFAGIIPGAGHALAIETRLLKRDGLCVDVEIAGTLTSFSGRPAILLVAHDITHRLGMEAQLRQGQKMEALGRLAGGVAHDFNNLLTAISMNAEVALDDMPAGSPNRNEIEEIQAATRRAAALTKQLLVFSRRQPLSSGVVDLTTLATGVQKLLRRLIPENITFDLDLAPDIPCIKADSGQLEQILMNLTVNARDAMPNGGNLRIATSSVSITATSHPTVSQMPPGRYARVSVTDTGTGMDARTVARVFEPFFTTKGVGHGTGLGLAMVHGLVTQFGGYLSVESSIGRGTAFDIYFPAVWDRPESAEDALPGNAESDATGTILLVEDDGSIRIAVARMLTREGFRVREAHNGNDALGILSEHNEDLILVLSDLVMPTMGGRELADSMIRTHPETKILLMSGYEAEAFQDPKTFPAGVGFIQKPFTRLELISQIRNLVGATPSVN